MTMHDIVSSLRWLLSSLSATPSPAQNSSQKLTLQQAEQIAIQNHPQIQAATNLASAAERK